MKFRQIFIISFVLISILGFKPLLQGDSSDTIPVYRSNTKVEFPKYIFSKIDKSKYQVTRTYFFEFKANEKGKIVDAGLRTGEIDELAKEIIKIVKKMPKWSPAQKDGKNVGATFVVPFTFK